MEQSADTEVASFPSVPSTSKNTNGFLGHLTEEQTAALTALKNQLSEITVNALGQEDAQKSVVSLWGVNLKEDSGSRDVILLKFLRARNFVVTDSATMLQNCLKWRKEFRTDQILAESFPPQFSGPIGYIYGTDFSGRPVMINSYGGLGKDVVFGDLDRFLPLRGQVSERGV
eukprot:GILI01076316.1.p1 GENE.GILI01076316.1~~GILI01076316.1.p1  ORF type:complete len:202 (+),score=43.15 GILI01076316.1:92-607(+)